MVSRSKAKRQRPARAVKPVLGNDPFARGAAPRVPAEDAPAPSLDVDPAAPVPAPDTPPGLNLGSPAEAPVPDVAPAAAAAREDALHRLESRVSRLASEGERRLEDLGARLRETASYPQARMRDDLGILASRIVPAVRSRLSALARLRQTLRGGGPLDPWGLDPELVRAAASGLDFLLDAWWRVEVRGLERVPGGPVIVVANHGGSLHWDALVLGHVFRRAGRELRPLLDAPALAATLGRTAVRLGAVAASADAAEGLLAQGRSIAVFPQGSRAGAQPWTDRYRLQQFGRGGFARIALHSGAPVIACAIVGSEEAALPFARSGWLAEALSMPLLAGAPGLPVGPLGAVPLPSRWTIRFGEPVLTAGRSAEAENAVAVNALAADVRDTLQRMLDEDVAARRSVYL